MAGSAAAPEAEASSEEARKKVATEAPPRAYFSDFVKTPIFIFCIQVGVSEISQDPES